MLPPGILFGWFHKVNSAVFSGAALTTFSGECGGMKEDTSCVTWFYDFWIVAKVIFLWSVILTAQPMSLCDFVGVFLQPVCLALRLCTCI